jgi:excisionase family DNA binding protein
MENIILSSIPVESWKELMRQVIKEEIQQTGNVELNRSKPISERELCKYLGISAPTAIRWRQKGKLPFMQIGSAIRYDLNKVISALEKKS